MRRCSHTLNPDAWEDEHDEKCQIDVGDDAEILETINGQAVWRCPHDAVGEHDGDDKCVFHLPEDQRPDDIDPTEEFVAIVEGERATVDGEGRRPAQFIDTTFETLVLSRDKIGDANVIDLRHAHIRQMNWDIKTVNASLDACGAVIEGEMDFQHATFEERADFQHATFEEVAAFQGTTFEGRAAFSHATFEERAFFWGATFGETADFWGATFEERAAFQDTSFEGLAAFQGATFEGEAALQHTTFEGRATFQHATFEERADFQHATFKREADFRHVTFEGRAALQHATFEERADFQHVTFKREEVFWSATFKGEAVFRGATFEGEAAFWSATFEQSAILSGLNLEDARLRDADLSTANLENAELEGADLRNTDFTGTNLENAVLTRTKLYGADFTDARLHGTLFGDARINNTTTFIKRGRLRSSIRRLSIYLDKLPGITVPKAHTIIYDPRTQPVYDPKHGEETEEGGEPRVTSNYTRAAMVYQELESLARENAAPTLASTCFAWRKDMQRMRYISDEGEGTDRRVVRWMFSWLSNLVTRYGESAYRVLATIALTILTAGSLYYGFDLIERTSNGDPVSLFEALYFSTMTFTTLGYGDFTPADWAGQLLAISETAAGVVLLALLVFVFGRRATR